MARYVTGLAVETVIEKTSAHKLPGRVRDLLAGGDEGDREAGLLDSEYQLPMLRYREEHLPAGVARRRGPPAQARDRPDPGPVFSQVQGHVVAVAHAHAEHADPRRSAPASGGRRLRRRAS